MRVIEAIFVFCVVGGLGWASQRLVRDGLRARAAGREKWEVVPPCRTPGGRTVIQIGRGDVRSVFRILPPSARPWEVDEAIAEARLECRVLNDGS